MIQFSPLILLALSACGEPDPVLIRDRSVVFIPDSRYFYCPVVDEFPNVESLTDTQIANLIVLLDT